MSYPIHVYITQKLEKQLLDDNDMLAGSYVEQEIKDFMDGMVILNMKLPDYQVPLSRGVVIYLDDAELNNLKRIHEQKRNYRDLHEVATAVFFYLLEETGLDLNQCLGDFVCVGDQTNYDLAKEYKEWYNKAEIVQK